MKRIILLIAALFTFAAGAHSQTVNEETARLVATNFWNSYRSIDVKPATVLSTLSFSEIEHMHIFDINGEGFVIVSGDLRVQPILAYSFNSTFPEELNPELGYWLRGYEAQLSRWNTETPGVDAESNKQWQPLLTAAAPDEPVSTTLAVPALMTTRWNQSPYYNKFCPYDSVHGGHAVVGCVATAMAQICATGNTLPMVKAATPTTTATTATSTPTSRTHPTSGTSCPTSATNTHRKPKSTPLPPSPSIAA